MNRRVRLGIIGLGVQGPVHAEWSANIMEAELVAVCDVVEDKAKKIASMYGCDFYTDYHQMLERKDLDAVFVVTPPRTHATVAIDAMKAGKHVAVEKPLCMNLEEAREMTKVAKKTGALDGYLENLCYAPAYSTAKKIILDGGIGDVFFVRCGESDGRGIDKYREESNETGQQGSEQKKPYGILHEGACHPIMYCRYLYDKTPVAKVYAETRTFPKRAAEDAAFLTITYSNGQVAWVDSSVYALGTFDDRAEIYGTSGTILADLYGFHMNKGVKVHSQRGFDKSIGSSSYPSGRGFFGVQQNWSHPIPDEEYSLGYFHEQKAFLKSILAGKRPEINFDDGFATLEVIVAAYRSSETGNPVKFPLSQS
ncbi:MAG: Gfo/Idh/MocA family protein [Nitrososphaerales archaeon]